MNNLGRIKTVTTIFQEFQRAFPIFVYLHNSATDIFCCSQVITWTDTEVLIEWKCKRSGAWLPNKGLEDCDVSLHQGEQSTLWAVMSLTLCSGRPVGAALRQL